MDRRGFLRRASLIAAGAVAADQLSLLDRLGWKRRFFPSGPITPTLYGDGIHDDSPALQALVDGRPIYDPRQLCDGWHFANGTMDGTRAVIRDRVLRLDNTVRCDSQSAGNLSCESVLFEHNGFGPAFHFNSPSGYRWSLEGDVYLSSEGITLSNNIFEQMLTA